MGQMDKESRLVRSTVPPRDRAKVVMDACSRIEKTMVEFTEEDNVKAAVEDPGGCGYCGVVISPAQFDRHARWHLRLRKMGA